MSGILWLSVSCAVGLVLLVVGGELLVRGALGLGHRMRWAPAAVGAVIVGAGTSAPELATALQGAARGEDPLVIGTVVGSNVANVVLILGLCALAAPVVVRRGLAGRHGLAMIGTAALLALLGWDGGIGRVDGLILLAVLAVVLFAAARDREAAGPDDAPHPASHPLLAAAFGLLLLPLGAHLLVSGAVGAAQWLGVDERLIGLSVVAVGTSLPELSSAVAASRQGQGDVVLGSLLGSNVFNIVAIVGVSAVFDPLLALGPVQVDLAVLLLVSVGVVGLLALRPVLDRRHGLVLLASYAALAASAL